MIMHVTYNVALSDLAITENMLLRAASQCVMEDMSQSTLVGKIVCAPTKAGRVLPYLCQAVYACSLK